MIIKFKSLILNNFMSFREADVKLDDLGYTLVHGINNCKLDNAKSNGSGKSSIWEALVWAITGETIRGTKDIVNKSSDEGTSVQLEFLINSDKYKIIRYKDDKKFGTNLKLYVNDEDKSGKGIRDTSKILSEYLPDLTSSLIGSVIVLGQGLPQRFTNNTPSGRKEVLEKLSKSDFMIEDIKNKLTERKSYLNQELRKFEDLDLQYSSQKNMVDIDINKTEQELASIVDKDFDSDIEKARLNLLNAKSNLDDGEYNKLNEELTNARNDYKNYDVQSKLEISELEKEFVKPIQDLQDEYTSLMANSTMLKTEIQKLESIKDVCPTCGQKLPDVHKVDTTDLHNKLNEVEANKSILLEKINLTKAQRDSKINELKDKQSTRKLELENLGKDINAKFTEAALKYNNAKADVDNAQAILNNLENEQNMFIYKKETLTDRLKTLKEQSKSFADKILYNNIDKDSIKTHHDIVNKMLTVATRDFRGFLLSEIINYINLKSKEYCKEIFNTEEIEFKLDGNDIYIGYCGKQYENLSGGEKQKIDLIVQFSIRDMLSQYLNFSSNILVLDEIFDNLDNYGCQNVLNMISNKLSDIESIFIITHHAEELDIPFDNELNIVKDESGISKVE